MGADIYKIPQPIPVDITYNVKIFCTKMRHLNEFNKLVLQKFTSRQAYTFVKGHYIPIILNNVSDESVSDIEKRKYYIQNYEFLMMGFLIDENEFEVLPAITRALTLFEVETGIKSRRAKKEPKNPENFEIDILFRSGIDSLSEKYPYTIDLTFMKSKNIRQYSIYINNDFIGDDLTSVNINTNDVIKIDVVKGDSSLDAVLKTKAHIPYSD
ncbi:MAG: hypothetical protein ACO3RV_03240, partial [Luteolibacter sp.]